MENMTPQQALVNLYNATRQLNVNAETHEALHKMASIVEQALKPKVKQDLAPKINNNHEVKNADK